MGFMGLLGKVEKLLPRKYRYPVKVFVFRILIRINFLNKKNFYQLRLNAITKYLDARKVFERFCFVNSAYWGRETHLKTDPIVLVEGFLAEYGPNYLIRTGIIAKALEKKCKVRPVVLLINGSQDEPYKKMLYESFQISECVGIYNDFYRQLSLFKKCYVSMLARVYFYHAKLLFLLRRGERFVNLSFRGVQIGDMLYDEIIKWSQRGNYTIKNINGKCYVFFKRVFVYFFVLEMICRKFNVKYYVSTHSQYVSYGLPLRYFHAKQIVCIETTDDQLFIYDDEMHFVPKYHPVMHKMIADKLPIILSQWDFLQQAKAELNLRFAGKIDQMDVRLAYTTKKKYSSEELRAKLNIRNTHPVVFVFAHIFSDAPQGAGLGMLFMDYYQWLVETIKCIVNLREINWIIKPHPSASAYNEEGAVAAIVNKFKKPDDSIYICPADFSTAGAIANAKAIITCQGTVGLEFACIGIPTILAGQPFYAGFGFTSEPKTRSQYFEMIANIKDIQSLTDSQIKTALAVYMGFKSLQNNDHALIDTALKSKVWGCDGEPDNLAAYELMTERLKRNSPKNSTLYTTLANYFSQKRE